MNHIEFNEFNGHTMPSSDSLFALIQIHSLNFIRLKTMLNDFGSKLSYFFSAWFYVIHTT